MNTPKRPLIVIIATLLACVLIAVWTVVGRECLFKRAFSIPCPTCGMTRAVKSLLKFDLKGAFFYHPLVFTLPLLYWTVVTELAPFKNKRLNRITVVSLISAFLSVWAVRLVVLLV
jgi:hypothetical protein